MFEGKKIIKRKISILILTAILLSLSTQVVAQQQDFIKENNSEKFLNELLNIKFTTDISKDITFYEIPAPVTVTEQIDVQQLVQKTNPEIPWIVTLINLTDYDQNKWASAILGLYEPHPEKSDANKVSVSSYPDKVLDLQQPKFEKTSLIEAILDSQQSMQSENPLMNLIWQINENIDFAIVGQHQLDMAYPDFVEYLKNDDGDQTKTALYAKFTLRF